MLPSRELFPAGPHTAPFDSAVLGMGTGLQLALCVQLMAISMLPTGK